MTSASTENRGVKLAILGGGGFRVPQVIQAVAAADAPVRVSQVSLYDTDTDRLAAISAVIEGLLPGLPDAPEVTATTDLDTAVEHSDFVFCAIRVGGTEGRTRDERVALDLGILGQETTGPGGLAYALRTLPVMLDIAARVKEKAPDAWFINFTNPAGIITEGLRTVLGDRVVGICDTPIGLLRRAAMAVTGQPEASEFDYVGLNHLGWLRSFTVDGRDRLPELLGDEAKLDTIEEARVVGKDWVRALGALPNEYLYYYYDNREAVARIRSEEQTRGEFLLDQQAGFYASATTDPEEAYALWQRVKHEREATYMAEGREKGQEAERDEADIESGGYQEVALNIMAALRTGRPSTMILNVRNGSTVPGLPEECVVEVPCTVDGTGIHPHSIAPVTGHMLALMQSVKAVEQLIIASVLQRDPELAWKAIAVHPLVDSVNVARELLERYREVHPELGQLFG
ncbi:MAG: 6-phospho-beta-glucosidase [Galactobacter sp.]